MLKEFKKFILRGNVVDLAVGVAIGAAFTSVVNSLVKDMITPLVTAITGERQFSNAHFTVNGSEFLYGNFINAVISFLIVGTVIFFLVVQPINKVTELAKKRDDTDEPTTKKCNYCFNEISVKANRCGFCTSQLKKAA